MQKPVFFIIFLFSIITLKAQLVEVQADYNSVGDVDFVAYNNSKAPLFLNINFADLENTSFNEPMPYIKMLEPGFNNLFTLERDLDADVPRFNYEIKYFRSNPLAEVNLDFPYLLPFKPGSSVHPFDVKSIAGFWGNDELKSWVATGFNTMPGQQVFASRRGRVVEIVGVNRISDPQTWYHTWNNAITLLQPDGTLICYRNVTDKNKNLTVGKIVQAGQLLGEIAPEATELLLLIFQNSLNSKNMLFIIPQFVTGENSVEMINSSQKYTVIHPAKIRALEMSKKEARKILGIKK